MLANAQRSTLGNKIDAPRVHCNVHRMYTVGSGGTTERNGVTETSTPIALACPGPRALDVGGFRVTEAVFPGQLFIESHYHARACLTVLLQGSLDKVFSGSTEVVQAGTTLTTPAEERHRDLTARDGARMLYIEPDHANPLMAEVLQPCQALFREICTVRDERIARVAGRISRELRALDASSALAIESQVLELLAHAAHVAEPGRRLGGAPGWLHYAQEYVHANFNQPLSVADVAQVAGVHPVHLARVFRRHLGVSVGDYRRRLRLTWAAGRLVESDLALAQVAAAAGFVDQSHFTRAFKRQTGMTPGHYRQTQRASPMRVGCC